MLNDDRDHGDGAVEADVDLNLDEGVCTVYGDSGSDLPICPHKCGYEQ